MRNMSCLRRSKFSDQRCFPSGIFTRLAEILIHVKADFGQDENSILQISLTREELANIVGTATESVIRLLSDFKQDKLIELNGRKIKILDEAGLIRISNLYN